ncbi:unnamed protein product, partial [Scytosiphon promiscuus]
MGDSSGQGRGLDAVLVTLNQTIETGGRGAGWFVSTLELQRSSLDICRLCRSFPTLHVHVEDKTPRSLWGPRRASRRSRYSSSSSSSSSTATTAVNTTGGAKKKAHVHVGSRVPAVRALRLTWKLPTNFLLQSVAIGAWRWLEVLRLKSYGPGGRIESLEFMRWPEGVTQLVLDANLETPVQALSWPPSLQRLTLGEGFKQRVDGVFSWPASLEELCFEGLERPIAGVDWPPSLRRLCL